MKIDEINDLDFHPEDLLGPPKIDIIGLGLISLFSFVGGIFGGMIVLFLGYFSFGQFSLQTGVSPLLLGMVTFFALIMMNYFYLWGLINIFPSIYRFSRSLYVQVTVFSIILYIFIALVYFIIGNSIFGGSGILVIYSVHILLNCFGLILMTGILSQYRYSLLVFYSNIISLIGSGILIFFVFKNFSGSNTAIFLLTGLIALVFFISTTITFSIYYLYYKMYVLTGSDPLGNIFEQIQKEEIELEIQAEKALFKK